MDFKKKSSIKKAGPSLMAPLFTFRKLLALQ